VIPQPFVGSFASLSRVAAPPDSLRDPPSFPGWAPPREWFRASVTAMSAALADGEISSRDLVDAHLERIAELDHSLHAFTEVLRDEARAIADTRDSERREGRSRGPLHGIPVSVKECFDFQGRPTTLGVPSRRDGRAARDAVLVRALREAGAIVLGRTNLSQLMSSFETDNPLFGRTDNPFSARHTAGGSSGGDAAAVGAGLSPLGFASDVGGSVRIPAHFSGVVGMVPTPSRLPRSGLALPASELGTLSTQPGLLARSVADVILALDALPAASLHELDPRVPPIADRPSRPVGELRVGVYSDDGVLAPSSAVIAAVERAADALRAAGASVVPYAPAGIGDLFFECVKLLGADSGAHLLTSLGEDPVAESLRPSVQWARLPGAVRRTMARVARLSGDAELGRLMTALDEKTPAELGDAIRSIDEHTQRLLASLRSAEVDAIVCPAFATPAPPHGGTLDLFLGCSYSLVWSGLGFAAGVVPVTRVHASEARRDRARGRTGRAARRVDEQSAGLPVGVQVVVPPWHDRTLLAVMQAIEDSVRSDVDFPRTPAG
jgi:fatty acid amide hydrolase